ISTLTLPVDCPGAFRPRGLSVSTHISTLALPMDCPGGPDGASAERT
ncbi:unnamed protein product, partial [Brassica oleracea]